MTTPLLYEIDADGIAWITFNRPAARNATSIEMIDALHAKLLQIDGDGTVRCVVLRGAGEHFVAGADLGALEAMTLLPPQERRAALQARLARSAPVFSLIERMEQPFVASVRGAVAGGGVGLMLACDLVVAATDSKFVLAQIKAGLSPDGGSSWHLPRAIGMKRAKQFALLGQNIDARTALSWGLVNWVVPPEEVHEHTLRIAQRLASGPARGLAQAKHLLNAAMRSDLAEQVALETHGMGVCAETGDFVEGVQAARQKRAPRFQKP